MAPLSRATMLRRLLSRLCSPLITFVFLSCTSSSPLSSAAVAPHPDRPSLLEFKNKIVDPEGALRSWNDSSHYCRWRGVTCGHQNPERVMALNLSSLGLSGYISPSIANLTFLLMIDLSNNQLYGIIPPQIGHLSRLRYLKLSRNVLGGEIPSNLSRCSEIQVISLWRNQLVGELPVDLGGLSRLVFLDVSSNHLTGAIPLSLANLSSADFGSLWLGDNNLEGSIPRELGRLTNLSYIGVDRNMLSGEVPSSLYNLSNIKTFQVSENQLRGTLPADLGTRLPRLISLNMGRNQFQGNIPGSLSNASSLRHIVLNHNNFSGTIPDNLGALTTSLEVVAVDYNALGARKPCDWNFLTSLTNCTQLKLLSISYNQFGGPLPDSISNLSVALENLLMGANQISGSIPLGIANLRGLTQLGMGGNRFTGGIPPNLQELDKLVGLELRNNQLSGEIPSELGNITQLSELYLDRNSLWGSIPTSFGFYQHLQTLDVSVNGLNGSIPAELFTLFTLVKADLSNNLLEGTLPSEIGHLINLQYLNVSINRLSGDLPLELGDCQSLEQLYLYGNSFEGPIPPSVEKMKGIEVLDLSLNKLTGKVPEFLEDLEFLRYLNLSFNNFLGEIPKNGVFANASRISLLGNKMICGGISSLHLPRCASPVEKKRNSSHSLKVVISMAVGGLCLVLSSCFIAYRCWMRKSQRKTSSSSSFDIKQERISYHDLVKATDDFSPNNLIGKGSFGSVYKGVLDGEKVVAVKVLDIQRQGASKSFKSECEALRNIRHRNLVKIISACSSIDSSGNDFKALVFEFFPNGSLEKWLHPESEVGRTLDFSQRLCIAANIASAVDYLHNHCHSPIIHCDLKPSNVLLDSDMVAHVGDFGLARFILTTSSENLENQSSTLGIKGTIGYVAPEYGLGSPISTSGDVYGFGILLLELFTAKRPTDSTIKDGLLLQNLVEAALSNRAMDIIDPHLVQPHQNHQNYNSSSNERLQTCFLSLMQIGLNCTKESPQERMTMEEVLREINHTQETFLGVARSTAS